MSFPSLGTLQESEFQRWIWVYPSEEVEEGVETSEWLWPEQLESETLVTSEEGWLGCSGLQQMAV